MNDNKESIFDKEMLFEKQYSDFSITEDAKKDIKHHPEKYMNCDVRIRMGLFYTDEEKERYIEDSLSRPLPSDNQEKPAKCRILSLFRKK